jgi:hypothetical protein
MKKKTKKQKTAFLTPWCLLLRNVKCYVLIKLIPTYILCQEQFEDTKGVIRIRKSKDRQHNDQKKKDKQHTCIQNIYTLN